MNGLLQEAQSVLLGVVVQLLSSGAKNAVNSVPHFVPPPCPPVSWWKTVKGIVMGEKGKVHFTIDFIR